MGLSSTQVSSDHGLDWSQTLLQAQTLELPKPPTIRRSQQQQSQLQSEPLKCPRCESTNTKFCYYNNYNKSQPRHFCKTCKRHWTEGGTLRNVPVGGGRKNKRLKTSKTTTNSNTNTEVNSHMAIQASQVQQQKQSLRPVCDQKGLSEILYQAMINPPSSSSLQQNSISCSTLYHTKSFNTNNRNDILLDSMALSTLPQNQASNFPYSSSSSNFDTRPSSISTSFQSTNVYNYTAETMEDSTITTIMPTTSIAMISDQPWQVPNTSSGMDMTNYWNWDDIENFVSADLNVPWDDPGIKP